MKRLLISTTSIIAIFASVSAFAEAEAPTPDVAGKEALGVDQIVVTATRTPQPLYRIGASITVLTEAVIKSSQTAVVSDLLTQMPGVSFTRNGGVGGVTSLRIRGAETDQTMVVIDGVKVNDPSQAGGGFNFGNLLRGDVQRIEILRGAQSTLWGSQAIGGVVNIVTAEPKKDFEVSAAAEGGSHGTGYGTLAAGGAVERLTWRLAGGYYTTDGISTFAGGSEKDGYRNVGTSGRLKYDITDTVSVDLRAVYSRGNNDYDGFPPPLFAFADTGEYAITREFVGYGALNFALLDGRLKNRVAYGYTDTDRDSFNPAQAVTTKTFDAVGRNKRWEYQGSFSVAEGWDAVFGAEHERSSFRTASPSAFAPNPTPAVANIDITSGYAQLQAEVMKNLTLTGGLRYDSHGTFGGHALGQAAAAYVLNGGDTILRASFGQGFKAPTLYQLFSVYGNPALTPEKADSYDGGIEQHFFDNKLTISAIGFYRKTRNQIDFVNCPSAHHLCTPGRFGVYDNVAGTKAQGVELAGAANLGDLTLQANYTYIDTENTSAGIVNRGKDLARRPRHMGSIWATYAWPKDISTGVAVRYVGASFDNAANSFVLQDYVLVDLRASWQVTENVELYGRIENLFDKAYVTARNYGTPGRGAFAGLRAKF